MISWGQSILMWFHFLNIRKLFCTLGVICVVLVMNIVESEVGMFAGSVWSLWIHHVLLLIVVGSVCFLVNAVSNAWSCVRWWWISLSKGISFSIWLGWMNLSEYVNILVMLSQVNSHSTLFEEQEGENSEMCLHLNFFNIC